MTERIRVTHLISDDLWAGAEVATSHLIAGLARLPEVSVDVVCLNEGELARRMRAAGVEVTVFPEKASSFPGLVRAVRRYVRSSALVHSHRYKENVLAGLCGRPWVATQHGLAEKMGGWTGLRARTYSGISLGWLRYSARRVIAVSTEIEEWLGRWIAPAKIRMLHNGIRDPAREIAPIAWTDRPPVVGVIGRLFPVKGIDLAIAALARCPELKLEIIGDGPLRADLELRCREAGTRDRVAFLGHLSDPLPRVARWRGLLVTSLHEGNPIAVLEALALGTPVVATRIRGVEEALGGQGGWLVDSRDPEVWARELLSSLGDPELASAASRAARARYLEEFTSEASALRMRSLYAEVLAEAPVRRRDAIRLAR